MGHGHDEPAAAGPTPTPQHVLTIAAIARRLGLAMWGGGFLVAWPLLWLNGWTAFFWAAFVSLYGMCIWAASGATEREAVPAA